MYYLFKSWIISVFIVLGLAAPAQAELLLFKRGNDGIYYAVDSQTYPKETEDNQKEIETIFKEILMKWQWPMVTINFYQENHELQEKYTQALKKAHGVTHFIQEQLDTHFNKGSYKVYFIPTTIFELAAINTSFETKTSIDFNKFTFADDIAEALRKYQGNPHADLFALKIATDKYNMSKTTFEMFLQTTSYLKNHHNDILLNSDICNNTNDNAKKLIVQIIKHNEKIGKRGHSPEYMLADDLDIFVKATELDCKTETENAFILIRGTGGYFSAEQFGGAIIDSPYLESVEEYTQALKGWPEGLKEQILMGLPKSVEKQSYSSGIVLPQEKKTFTPASLSLGNSLMAGTFKDSKEEMGARALDHIRKGFGYAIIFPIVEFFKGNTKPTLHQKYMISALHPLVSLWAEGEIFHSRSKISIYDPNKTYVLDKGIRFAKGLISNVNETELVKLDINLYTGFIVTPNVDWTILHSNISKDIAEHLVWVKEPIYDKQEPLTAQNRFALFTSIEMSALRNYFSKLESVLVQIKNPPPLIPANIPRPVGGGEVKLPLSVPMTKPEQRTYEQNVFTGIAQNPANLNTKQLVFTDKSISFDDLRKRTKEHALVIPKGHYISFSHFVDFALPEEILDLMRTVADTAKQLGIDKTGYRIITNNSLNPGPGKVIGNDANQEVPHFHIHLAGGECLGKNVVGGAIDMKISQNPFASDWTPQQFYRYTTSNKIAERIITGATKETTRKIVAYRINEGSTVGVEQLIGFLILNDKSQTAYTSIDDFAQHANANEMVGFFKFMNDVARQVGIYKSGYRLISDFGNDAQQYPKNIMNILMAGGGKLGNTVSNMYGNFTVWEVFPHITDYDQLLDYPHDHCAATPYDTFKLLEKIEENKPEEYQKKEKEAVIIIKQTGNVDSLIKEIEKIEKPELVTKMSISRNHWDQKIEKLPDIIPTKFKNLKILDISNNGIKYLPENIGDLKHLKLLDASGNKLETIPESIGELSELEKLYLTKNDLKTLPPSISKLKKLKILKIDSYNMGMEYSIINSVQDYFFGLVQKGDTKTVMNFIDNGIAVDAKNANGNTPLMEASIKGATVLALALIHKKEQEKDGKIKDYIEEKNKAGDNALLYAANFGQNDTALALIKAGANMEAKNRDGDTPLMLGVLKGHTPLIKALINAGADITTKNNNANNLLTIASLNGSLELVKTLIEKIKQMDPEGYQKYIDAKNSYGNNALLLAADYNHVDVALELIKEGASIDVSNKDQDTTLIIASMVGNLDVIKALLEKKKKTDPNGFQQYIDKMNAHGLSPMMFAIGREHNDVALALIQAGANVKVKVEGEMTILQEALSRRQKEVAFALIQAGADIDATDNNLSPLMSAIKMGYTDVVKALIEKKRKIGAQEVKEYINTPDQNGRTALYYAVRYGEEDVAMVLIDAGVSVVNAEGDASILDMAYQKEFKKVIQALEGEMQKAS